MDKELDKVKIVKRRDPKKLKLFSIFGYRKANFYEDLGEILLIFFINLKI